MGEDTAADPLAGEVIEIDLRHAMMEEIEKAVGESPWVPAEYYMNEVVSDICDFLRRPRTDAEATEWSDKPDDLTDQIKAAHPHHTRDFATYTRALEAVSNRHSKGELVNLVNFLMSRNAAAEARVAVLKGAQWQWRSKIKGGAWDAWENGRYGQPVPPFMEIEERATFARAALKRGAA
jgi:hypothetical protein